MPSKFAQQHFRLGDPPAWMKDHNARTWTKVSALFANSSVVSFEELCETAIGHMSGQAADRNRSPEVVAAGFIRYCITEGWLTPDTDTPVSLPAAASPASPYPPEPDSPTNVWAVIANPDVFDAQAAAEELEEITWDLPRGDAAIGDRILVWQASGGMRRRRGIVALATVVGTAEERPPTERSRPFWTSHQALPDLSRRLLIRFNSAPGLPLWLDTGPTDPLSMLSVSRAQGNRLYLVTLDQWEALLPYFGLAPQQAAAPFDADARRTQGFSQSPEARRAVDRHAMSRVCEYFESLGYSVVDTSATESYDLEVQRGQEHRFVEVKGTTGTGESVIVTRNEVEHARTRAGECILAIVRGVVLSPGEDGLLASGGSIYLEDPWLPDDANLQPIQYFYEVKPPPTRPT